ncbi:D-lyxose/D-mannose family sugar isomerase [Thorsellia kenyensis]|uniref:D-lyxose ketol-isomerase n=1 Tax=Thorsellia kenyensis TaxID=1549888 RepID=A0ABV6CH88_9GAMM
MKNNHFIIKTLEFFDKANIILSNQEKEKIEIATFNLDSYPQTGLQLITYINEPEYCAKDLILFPHQTCPEHKHPPVGSSSGKKETFRCRYGEVVLFVDDNSLTLDQQKKYRVPKGDENWYTCDHYIILKPGDQYTIEPNTLHWFQAGIEGAVISEFSSQSRDEYDIFTDPRIIR